MRFKGIIICAFLLGCSQDHDEPDFEMNLQKNALMLKVDNQTSNISRGLQGKVLDSNEFLISVSWKQNSLQIYDLDSEKIHREIFFEEQGPNGIGNIFGYEVKNFDSIYLFPQFNKEIIHTDSSGTIRDRITYSPPATFTPAFVHNSYFLSSPVFFQDKMLVKTHIMGNYREITQKELSETPMGYFIDMKTGKTTVTDFTYPQDYLSQGLKSFEYSMAESNDRVVYSFFGDHRLFYTNKAAKNTLQSVNAKSKYLDKLPVFPADGERQATYDYLFASDRYESLLFDPFRNIFYRIAIPAVDYQEEEGLSQFKLAPRRFVVMALDKELNVIGEYLLDSNTYLPGNIFVGRKGLYLSTSHPKNPDNKEDFMIFDCLIVSSAE